MTAMMTKEQFDFQNARDAAIGKAQHATLADYPRLVADVVRCQEAFDALVLKADADGDSVELRAERVAAYDALRLAKAARPDLNGLLDRATRDQMPQDLDERRQGLELAANLIGNYAGHRAGELVSKRRSDAEIGRKEKSSTLDTRERSLRIATIAAQTISGLQRQAEAERDAIFAQVRRELTKKFMAEMQSTETQSTTEER